MSCGPARCSTASPSSSRSPSPRTKRDDREAAGRGTPSPTSSAVHSLRSQPRAAPSFSPGCEALEPLRRSSSPASASAERSLSAAALTASRRSLLTIRPPSGRRHKPKSEAPPPQVLARGPKEVARISARSPVLRVESKQPARRKTQAATATSRRRDAARAVGGRLAAGHHDNRSAGRGVRARSRADVRTGARGSTRVRRS